MTPERHRFVERLAYYLMGIAIGLLVLGMFWSARQRAAATGGAGTGATAPTPTEPQAERPAGADRPQ